MSKNWNVLAKSGGLEKLKVGELKGFLKENGLSQTGEKGTLMFRIKAFLDGEGMKVDGRNPATMKAGELKKECAKRGLSPMGYPDELLESLINYLKTHGGADKSTNAAPGVDPKSTDKALGKAEDNIGDDGDVASALVHRIMQLGEEEDWAAILNLGCTGLKVSRQSPTALLRKCYHRLSLNVHPDRLGGSVPEATKAFQAVVTAFERLSKPEREEEQGNKKGKAPTKTKTLARSNENCFRSRIYCPRCRTEWGQPIDGLPPYTYNYMMMGLKTFVCSTCLCDFGALTALHKCPHCRRSFEYDPHDYHRQVVCGNKGCTKPFGFFLFPVSDRVEKEMRGELRAEQERRLRARESKLARLARSKRKREGMEKGEGEQAADDRRLQLRLFVQGLLDACPRCGEEVACKPEDREAHKDHLRGCHDEDKIEAHREKARKAEAHQADKEAKRAQQEDLQSLRTWEFLGGKEGELWLLTDGQLAHLCKEKALLPKEEIDETGMGDKKGNGAKKTTAAALSKDEMIAKLVAHSKREGPVRLTDGTESGDVKRECGEPNTRFSRDSLPDNLHGMSLSQLRAVCAAHGYVPQATSQSALVRELERAAAKVEGHEETLLLED
ncbi:hypothetical protein NSK_000752 [Nannochloropsis salina CCMP1776]|jgi:hypothetical protein|uniref:J domain-containing protein n=1 Tax=Nannochloropsis salina CCMP1776 TaxID=1027361 RepID=A0A4D9DE60_9STRA|nr:hypothetical protein NSK_000752 [Nannochloropsis salina CCMP1776]|eukprot:TFJ88403.1 hypothetical protein NSK_000752 [Nannochloropsis salina CCMP1776]